MSTHNILLSIYENHHKLSHICLQLWDISRGLRNEFEIAMVNELLVLEPLKFYWT